MIKYIKNSSLIFLGAIFLCSFLPEKDNLLREWRNERYNVEVIMFKKDDLYYGNVTEAGNEKGNEKIKKGPMQVLQDFEKTSDSTYCCGSIYLPKTGNRIYSDIEMIDPNSLQVIGHLFGITMVSN